MEVLTRVAIRFFNGCLSLLYSVLKLIPTNQKKIVFCSRQSDEVPLDFVMLEKCIREKAPDTTFEFICKKIHPSPLGYLSFLTAMIRSMYHLATSKVCIIDSYWPPVSMLKHKDSLKVIQIWHSLGKTKRSGYQSLDKKSGRKGNTAKLLKMHNNYDYVVGGAKIWNKYYCEAFDINEEQIINCGLPRIDYLLETEKSNRKRFFQEHPELVGKKVILYTPTFRRNMENHWDKIFEFEKMEDAVVILKNHPGQPQFEVDGKSNIIDIDNWKTMDLISICDYLITDYSSIALEAAVLNKKTYYWTYDYDEYMSNSGINIDLKKELPGNLFEDINDIIKSIETDAFDIEQFNEYRKKYLPETLGTSTEFLSNFVVGIMAESRGE